MRVRVTEENIKAGTRFDRENCPISCSILATKQNVFRCRTGGGLIEIAYTNKFGVLTWTKHSYPGRVMKWIVKYDSGEEVEPIEFVARRIWDEDNR